MNYRVIGHFLIAFPLSLIFFALVPFMILLQATIWLVGDWFKKGSRDTLKSR